ncbi:hypothetical protein EMCRGX_G019151 [Ephydatia muelleri]
MGEGEENAQEMFNALVQLESEPEQLESESKQLESESFGLALEPEADKVESEALSRPGLVVTIQSVQFPNVFLRLDGNGVNSFNGAGVGKVNCQFGAGPYEKFILRPYAGDQYSIESLQFPNVYLRLDGGQVTSFQGSGSGIVNGQFGAGPYERFVIRQEVDGQYSIQSVQFPQAFLRVDGSNVQSFNGAGAGNVNAQYGVGPWEKFKITVL